MAQCCGHGVEQDALAEVEMINDSRSLEDGNPSQDALCSISCPTACRTAFHSVFHSVQSRRRSDGRQEQGA